MGKQRQPADEAALLRLVIEGTVAETGTSFFKALVKNLCEALGTMGAWVTEYIREENKLRAYAMWMNGAYVDDYEYCLAGTPCQPVIEDRRLVHIPDQVIDLFPKDSDLRDLDAVSYIGAPVLDTDGSVIGHLGLLDSKVMSWDPRAIAVFEIFAARAAGEMRRLKTEQALRASEQQLSRLLESALDAIIVVDRRFRIVRVNPAAERLFNCAAGDLVDRDFAAFLIKDSAEQLQAFAREIGEQPSGRQQLWVPKDFIARRMDQSIFPAEATLSRFETREGVFHTLILRNADERLEAERKIQLLTQETDYLRDIAREVAGDAGLIGQSDCMQAVQAAIRQVAPTDSTVLITGETGTGKELVARSIHQHSGRSGQPLVIVNCAAIPASLIESEFFGHEKGAFTGAVQKREGRFKLADGGTIFLDEVGELPLELQAKLLRVLQEGEFEPLGTSRTVKVDVRVVAATNRDLRRMAAEGSFREDLYFRLNVFPLAIPPLRDRGRDASLLAAAFTERFARRMGKRIGPLSKQQLACLAGYEWPGNVRELQNVIERAVILTNGPVLALERAMSGLAPAATPPAAPDQARILTAAELQSLERANLVRALEACGWKVSGEAGAARLIGIPATTLTSRLKALGIRKPAG